jgi:hypothetical protein
VKLFAEEQERIRRERTGAEKLVDQLTVEYDQVTEALDVALGLTDRIQDAYRRAEPMSRRLFNQAFFERLEVDSEEIVSHTLAEPFSQLRSRYFRQRGSRSARTPSPVFEAGGSYVQSLVRLRGLEPPRTLRSTRPSTLTSAVS